MSRSILLFALFALLAVTFVSASSVDSSVESVDASLVETDSGRGSSRFAHLAELLAELEARESAGAETEVDAESESEEGVANAFGVDAESELDSWESIMNPGKGKGKAGKGKAGKAARKAGKAVGKAFGKLAAKVANKAKKAVGKALGKKTGKKGAKKGPRKGTSVKTCRNRAYVRYLHTLRLLVRSQVLQKARRHGGKTCPKNDAAISALVDKSVASIPTNPLGVVALRMLAQDLRLCNAGKLLSRAFKSVGLKKFPTWRPYGKKGKNAGKKGGKGKGKKAAGKGKKVGKGKAGKAAGKGKAGKAGKAAGKGKAGKAGKKFYMFNEMSSEVFSHTELEAEAEMEAESEVDVARASWPWGTANKRGEKHTVDAIWNAFTSKLAKNAHDAAKRAAGLESICKKGKAGKGARHAIDPVLNTRLDPLKVQLAKNFEAIKGKKSKNPHHARDLASLL